MSGTCGGWVLAPVAAALLLAGGQASADPSPEVFNPTNASLDELVSWAQVYVSTPAKKEARNGARDELFARRGESVRYLFEHLALTNDTIRQLAYELIVYKMPPDEAAPVLADFLAAPDGVTRRAAAYYLGFTQATNLAPRVMPLLDDELTAGAAARTLGKWKVRAAAPAISAMLKSDKEPRRVMAGNALRDIGDASAVPALMAALDDPIFTVRKVAARALALLGRPAEKALLAALPASRGLAQREIVRTLGAMRAKQAVKPLRKLLRQAEGGLHQDIVQALSAIAAGPGGPP
ncbi:MAG: HEAT repeat domain-containing protein [Lentisphaerae bacterium]|nr:HEAT repeat domain-containing protein [Lentisphaerota bacterium]